MTSIMSPNFYLQFHMPMILNGKHLDVLIIRINRELELLFTWLQANKLSLNGQKTCYILFHRARIKVTNQSSTLVMGGSILNVTNEIPWCDYR